MYRDALLLEAHRHNGGIAALVEQLQNQIHQKDQMISDCSSPREELLESFPVLIGEPGVGKTAISEGLAQRIMQGDVPQALMNQRLISLDMGALIAGAKYHGEFEDRFKALLKEVTESERQIILFIDEIDTVVGAERVGEGLQVGNRTPTNKVNALYNRLALNGLTLGAKSAGLHIAAIDLVDEAAAELKMEITSKPTALDEINHAV
ncbi:hypothetical protein H5410_064180 [Solanum commersonii]|uniref:AAA+ ATPase domain-containing protein n=1 Tax=Solanum commersonii TaxID=4109 RepID=A0A9J5W0V1_SOLCO|nr:hypothetical protein H5410_064180 [Solanum commersonii]